LLIAHSNRLLTSCSIEDEAALVAKVNEAMAVYEEYVKSQQAQQSQAPAAAPQAEAAAEKPKEEKAEEQKA